jgi:hypothetical protein
VAVDSAGDVYVLDIGNQRVVELTEAGTTIVLSTGSVAAGSTPGCTAVLCFPYGMAVGSGGNVYIADTFNNRIVEVSQAQTAPLSFADTLAGQASAEQDVNLQNIGNEPLNLTALGTATTGQTASSFNLSGLGTTCTGSTSLTPGENCGLGVEFAPLAAEGLGGTVNITDNNLNAASPGDTLQQIAVSGIGTGYAAMMGLTESATTVAYGTPTSVTVTATLTGLNGIPTGTVSYSVDGVTLGSAPLTVGATSSTAQISLPNTISAGMHGVVVTYAGDSNYFVSTSEGFTLTVTPAGTTTLLSAPESAPAGSSVNLVATVMTGAPITGGLVTFSSTNPGGTVSLGAAQLGPGGTATLATTALPVGIDSVTASFAATQNFAGSTSSGSTVLVSAAIPPSYSITANPATLSIAQGATGSTTLTFTPVGGYSGTLTLSCGNLPSFVTCGFTQNGVSKSTVTMNGSGQAVTATLTIDTNSSAARLQAEPAMRHGLPGHERPQGPSSTILLGMIVGWPGLGTGLGGLAAAFARRRKGTKRRARLAQLGLLAVMAAAVLAGFSGCGGTASSVTQVTPTGSSTILITATQSSGGSGSLASQTLSFSVTITQ